MDFTFCLSGAVRGYLNRLSELSIDDRVREFAASVSFNETHEVAVTAENAEIRLELQAAADFFTSAVVLEMAAQERELELRCLLSEGPNGLSFPPERFDVPDAEEVERELVLLLTITEEFEPLLEELIADSPEESQQAVAEYLLGRLAWCFEQTALGQTVWFADADSALASMLKIQL